MSDPNPTLATRLRVMAVCETHHPADAAAALVEAAAAVLLPTFPPAEVASMLGASLREALATTGAAPIAAIGAPTTTIDDAELVRLTVARAAELRARAPAREVAGAMVSVAAALVEREEGRAAALALVADVLDAARRAPPRGHAGSGGG